METSSWGSNSDQKPSVVPGSPERKWLPGIASAILRNPAKALLSAQPEDPDDIRGPELTQEELEQRQKESAKGSLFQTIATIVLIGLIVVSFVMLFTSYEEILPSRLGKGGGMRQQSFRKFALFFPCEAIGHANPKCEEQAPAVERPPRKIDVRKSLDYVSKKDPPPGFERWLEFATENQCHMGSYTRIEKDMEAFRDSRSGKLRILRHHVEGAKNMSQTLVFRVTNGSLQVDGVGTDNHRMDFQRKFSGLMSRFVRHLPDMEFIANVMDEPRVLPGNTADVDERMASPLCRNASESFQKFRHLHGFINNRQTAEPYVPNQDLVALFSQTKINDCHRDIMFPTLYNLESHMSSKEEDELKPWKERDDILFFRGTTTGGDFINASAARLSHRQRLVKYAKDKPNMDIGFVGIIQCEKSVCHAMEEEFGVVPRVPYMDNFKHKYLMSIDGNTFVSRLPKFMQSASLMFRTGIFSEWFEEWIREDEHFVRVSLDYSNLDSKIQWAKDHDEEARKIGLQGRNFSKKHLRREDMECYLYRLLLEYAAILEL